EELFFELCGQLLRPYAALWVRNEDVEDVIQDTLVIVVQRLRENQLAEPEKAFYYAVSVARKICIALIRKEARRKTSPDTPRTEYAADAGESPEEALVRDRVRRMLRDQIQLLNTPRDREVLKRFYLEEEDRESICEAMQLTSSQLSRVLYRSKARLREIVEVERRTGVRSGAADQHSARQDRRPSRTQANRRIRESCANK
ncbi:MAG: sigma-70 family RNA polymerase sigma factor, partial [Pseudomonadota bacterium]